MDPGTAVVLAAAVTSFGGIVVTLIGVFASSERAKLSEQVRRQRRQILELGGDPDDDA